MKRFSPSELRAMPVEQAAETCREIRRFLWDNVTQSGGHVASNLGIAEISVALVRILDLPRDRVIYDTGHQCYVHKILTRAEGDFSTLRSFGGMSGFPSRAESEFDPFGTGHSGTGLSAALGFAAADRLQGRDSWTVVVLGDGAFTGGMVFEALNNVQKQDRVILILNDNGMSISKSTGRLKGVLGSMRTRGYYRLKDRMERALKNTPRLHDGLVRVKDYLKRSAVPQGNLFETYGLHYYGPADGNDLEQVEFLLREAKRKARPAVIHLCTKKGKGKKEAEADPSRFHGISPAGSRSEGKSFSSLFGESLVSLAQEDERVCAVTAAMTDGVGLAEFAEKFPKRFFDVGIAEEHAATFAAGLAAAGMRPVFAVYSTFFQRAFDQLLHDCALQGLPVTFCLDRAGLVGQDGATHHGMFDLPLCLSAPGVRVVAPCGKEELARALREAVSRTDGPTVIRYPKASPAPLTEEAFPLTDPVEWLDLGEGEEKTALVSFGRTVETCLRVAKALSERGCALRVVRFGVLKGYDPACLSEAFAPCRRIFFAEEGILEGGFSRELWATLSERGLTEGKKCAFRAVSDGFVTHGSVKELLREVGLDEENLKKEVEEFAKT